MNTYFILIQGQGFKDLKPTHVADAMLDAVVAVVRKKPNLKLNLVRIVLVQQDVLKEFHSCMLKKEGMKIEEKQGFFQTIRRSLAVGLYLKSGRMSNILLLHLSEIQLTLIYVT